MLFDDGLTGQKPGILANQTSDFPPSHIKADLRQEGRKEVNQVG